VTSVDVGVRKPHALIFETALRTLGVRPEESVMVGDSYEIDLVPAAVLGMAPILKLNECKPDPAFTLARHQIASLEDLLRLPPLADR
jgi:putative hydrolase of the HAD superfamily